MADIQAFQSVKIRLLVDPPVSPKHSLFAGQVCCTVPPPAIVYRDFTVYVQGFSEPVGLFAGEFEIFEDENVAAFPQVLDDAYWKSLQDDLPF